MKNIGEKIRALRERKKLTQDEVGKYIGTSKQTLYKYEMGIITNIPSDKIELLAKLFDVSPAYLMGWEVESNLISEKVRPEQKTENQVPLIGSIAAGSPILAEQNIEEYFTIDKSIKADFALRIKGDSMIDAGIHNGDIAFIRKQQTLETGEIGAVVIENEATLKRFYKTDSSIVLQPENKEYQPIIKTEGDVYIAGKLVAVLNIVK